MAAFEGKGDFRMSHQPSDPRRPAQDKPQKTARVGQPGEERRTSQENAGSTQGGGTRNAGNSIERAADDGGAGRERQARGRAGDVAKDDGISREDIEAGNDSSSR
jgi:hypothetical protein